MLVRHFYLLLCISAVVDSLQFGNDAALYQPAIVAKRNTSSALEKLVYTASFGTLRQAQVDAARQTVDSALEDWALYNKARFENPRRNVYTLKPDTFLKARASPGLQSPIITEELASAAALVAEVDASLGFRNGTILPPLKKRASSDFWMQTISRSGTQPYGNDPSYQVFRNVKDFGATGNGKTDDTKAINAAISAGNRCGQNCYSSTVKNAMVYFPGGTYLISSPLIALYGTQMIGNPNDLPILKSTSRFIGLGVISTDGIDNFSISSHKSCSLYLSTGGKGIDGRDMEYYINTANFYRQIRNFVVDVRDAIFPPEGIAGVHYQVSQATSMFNVKFLASEKAGNKHRSVFAENGSGGFISDLTFQGGQYGIQGGNQQFTAHRLTFANVQTAIWVFWDWGWTWKSIKISGCNTGFNLTSEQGIVSQTGSLLVQDSSFENTPNAIVIFPPTSKPGGNNTGVTLDNVSFKGVTNAIVDTKGKTWLAGSVGSVNTFVLGPVYNNLNRTFTFGSQVTMSRPDGLVGQTNGLPKPIFFERQRPQYNDLPSSRFISVRKNGAKGDGRTDDTVAVQNVLNQYASTSNVIYFDAGSYVLTDTIKIPPGAKIVGELWAQLVAKGAKFSDDMNPRPMLQVGQKGQRGSVEIQDLLFTTEGATQGLVNVEWNLEADQPGSAAMWDCHVRIGGATGSQLTTKECPPLKSGQPAGCAAGSLMFHLTPTASAYLENIWLWVADHDLDDPALTDANNTMAQLSVYVARGMLIESQKPTWLYGHASEHSTFYQYSFYKAKNVHAGMVQTESAYYQPNPKPPLPFYLGSSRFPGDPGYQTCKANKTRSGCDSSWAIRLERCSDISFAGAGLYSWFNTFDESCVDTRTCQKSLVELKNNGKNINFLNLITIGAENIATFTSAELPAAENESSGGHPKWTHLAALQISGDGKTDDEVVYVDPIIWSPNGPSTVTCDQPCTIVLPPSPLPIPKTINFELYPTSLEIGWSQVTTGSNGLPTTEFTGTTVTTTLAIPSVVVRSIDYWNIIVTNPAIPFNLYPTRSIVVSPFTITESFPSGVPGTPGTRIITPPPYPWRGIGVTTPGGPVATYVYDGRTIYVSNTTTLTITRTDGHTLLFGPTGIVIDGRPVSSPTSSTTTNGITIGPPLLWFTSFPSKTVSLITSEVASPTTTNIDGTPVPVIPCAAWFFFICIRFKIGGLILFGFELPGIYPIGGPPPFPRFPIPPGIEFPPKFPWPEITIGPNHIPTYASRGPDDEPCETTSASDCTTTVSIVPSTTRTVTGCSTATGCKATNAATATTTSACALTNSLPRRIGAADDCGPRWAFLYPVDNPDSSSHFSTNLRNSITVAINSLNLEGTKYLSTSPTLGAVFWALEKISDEQITTLLNDPLARDYIVSIDRHRKGAGNDLIVMTKRGEFNPLEESGLQKRGENIIQRGAYPEVATISEGVEDFTYDSSAGEGMHAYIVEWGSAPHDELKDFTIRWLYAGPQPVSSPGDKVSGHGTCVAAKFVGKTIGIARKVNELVQTVINTKVTFEVSWLDGIVKVYDDIKAKGREKTSVVNLSWQGELSPPNAISLPKAIFNQAMVDKLGMVIRRMLADGVVVAVGAGNTAGAVRGYPARFGIIGDPNYMPDLIVVGGSDAKADHAWRYSYGTNPRPTGSLWAADTSRYDVPVFAPSADINCPDAAGGWKLHSGTSFASPVVAGLAAYFKALDKQYMSPAAVKAMILRTSKHEIEGRPWPNYPPIARNGIGRVTCNVPRAARSDPMFFAMGPNASESMRDFQEKRQNTPASCSISGGTGGSGTDGLTLSFTSGQTPGPTCVSGGCGKLCDANSIFCLAPGPNSENPDFYSPLDPRSPQNPSNPDYTPSVTTSTTRGATTATKPTTTSTTSTQTVPTGPSQIVEVYMDTTSDQIGNTNAWLFFDTTSDGKNAPCEASRKTNFFENAPDNLQSGKQAYPSGTYKITTHGLACTYTGTENNIGKLDCPGKSTTCESRLQEVECPFISDFKDVMTWQGVCYWYN